MMHKEMGGFCDFFYDQQFKEIYEDLQTHIDNKTPWGECPWTKGSYVLKKYLFQGLEKQMPAYVPGSEKWRIFLDYSIEGKSVAGFVIYAVLRNDNNLMITSG
jgi:hypothetical protein